MINQLLLASWLAPLLLAPFSSLRMIKWLAPLALVPALMSLILLENGHLIHLDWLLLGTHLGLDQTSRWILSGSLVIWTSVALFCIQWQQGKKHSSRFYLFFLLAMSGNLLLILAMDMISFYLGFALMGLSAYGLIANQSDLAATKAGKLYLTQTIMGEVILFCGIVLMAGQADSFLFSDIQATVLNETALILIVLGFGIKIALPLLHTWLPVTYSALPAVVTAVFSGPMISAGILGMLRFLPHQEHAYGVTGLVLVTLGLIGSVYGIVIGLLQTCPKAALAYSSMSKMGLLAATIGLSLLYPMYSTVLLAAIVIYTVHHLLVKSALFLGIALLEQGIARTAVLGAILVLCFTLAGLPFSTGAIVKMEMLAAIPEHIDGFYLGFSVLSIASIFLMGRIFYLLMVLGPQRDSRQSWLEQKQAQQIHSPLKKGLQSISIHPFAMVTWFGLVLALLLFPLLPSLPLLSSFPWISGFPHQTPEVSNVLIGGAAIMFAFWVSMKKPRVLTRWLGTIPLGDVIHPFNRVLDRIHHRILQPARQYGEEQLKNRWNRWRTQLPTITSIRLPAISQSWAGILWCLIATIIWGLSVIGTPSYL